MTRAADSRLLLLGFVCLSLFLASGCTRSQADVPRDGRQGAAPPMIEVVQAREGPVPLRERVTGTVRASGELTIFPEATGPVVEVFAQNGDTVKKGAPLVRIQATGGRAQLLQARRSLDVARAQHRQAQAQYRELAAEYERNRALESRGLVARSFVDSLGSQTEAARAAASSAAAQVQVAEAAVAEQSDVQAQTLVRAPITGRIGQRNVEVGMRVNPQTPLFVMGGLDRMRVEVPVTQGILTRIREGQLAELRPGGNVRPIVAKVSRISPFLQPGSFSAEVEIDVPNESGALMAGMFVTVDILYGETAPTTLVPASALFEDPQTGETGVFVASEPPPPPDEGGSGYGDSPGKPTAVPFRSVQVVAAAPQIVGVTDVKPGEWVAVVGQHLLSPQRGEGDPQATLRLVEWDRIIELQQLQRQDLLKQFMERQQRARGES